MSTSISFIEFCGQCTVAPYLFHKYDSMIHQNLDKHKLIQCIIYKQNSKKIYAKKCSVGVHKMWQTIKFRFENFIHKNKLWGAPQGICRDLRRYARDFVHSGSADLERAVRQYLKENDSERATVESKFSNRYIE